MFIQPTDPYTQITKTIKDGSVTPFFPYRELWYSLRKLRSNEMTLY